ncbi:MAG: 30S ribosomal protein S6 [Phycisphaerales bacterium]|nr:30S ribosomal protein S6 [Phycisphaerales bacterium]
MSALRTHTYEAMFLFPQSASADLKSAADHVHSLLDRAKAEVISFAKWDERRLAYEIQGNKRGVYFLTYFRTTTDNIAGLERNANLSEQILRFMITRADHVPAEEMQTADGRERLADEINLRATQADESSRPETVEAGAEA